MTVPTVRIARFFRRSKRDVLQQAEDIVKEKSPWLDEVFREGAREAFFGAAPKDNGAKR